MAKSSAERVRRSHDKYRSAGLMRSHTWVHPEESVELKALAARLPKTRKILQKLGLT